MNTAPLSIEELSHRLDGSSQRLLGLDLGTKTIGLALSDVRRVIATPFDVIKRKKFTQDCQILIDIINTQDINTLVIGLPLNMDGSEGARAQATRAFVRNFSKINPTPFVLWDERLTTMQAERAMIANDVSRAKRQERIDAAAACIILQNVLDRLHYHNSKDP